MKSVVYKFQPLVRSTFILYIVFILLHINLLSQNNQNCDSIYLDFQEFTEPMEGFNELLQLNRHRIIECNDRFQKSDYTDSLLLEFDFFDKSAFGKCGYFVDFIEVREEKTIGKNQKDFMVRAYAMPYPNPCFFEIKIKTENSISEIVEINFAGFEL